MSPTGWAALICLLAGVLGACLLFRPTTHSKSRPSSDRTASERTQYAQQGVRLTQIELGRDVTDTDIDIIAIHGLDTTSRDTWTWKDPKDLGNEAKWVNWLHPGMLPEKVDRVRIFTCDWPANLLLSKDLVPKTIDEYAQRLLEGIHTELFADGARRGRPIVFIASCFGGIILTRALLRADDKDSIYRPFRNAVRGIVFLSTPFRGTSFQDVAAWAEPGLKVQASLQGRRVSKLLDSVKGSTFDLQDLVRTFTRLCQDKEHSCHVFTFYELGLTSLPLKAFPWLPSQFHQKKQLVDGYSGTLDFVSQPSSLDRSHLLMNKFQSPECSDYKQVAGKISEIVEKTRAGTPLAQADNWIQNMCYTEDRLKIERLSGELLLMDRCYINLTIVETLGQDARHALEGNTKSSPFSLWSRQKVETPDKTTQVELATLFGQRKGRKDEFIKPRRIMIRGRAGVGKTTLCKKIIHEFTQGAWAGWNELFDRILWVPLRNLKLDERRRVPGYNFEHLFSHEYFSLPKNLLDLAKALSEELETKSEKTLFLLDGLDEVSQDLAGDDAMSRFLKALLDQPNVIITSRPSGTLPAGKHVDLELETIGFYPDQVDSYIERAVSNPATGDDVQSFLKSHWLIKGLVRIPIQLDALCYTWEDLDQGTVLDTMTGMYKAIEKNLWRKDAVRMNKKHDQEPMTVSQIALSDVEGVVMHEIEFLEALAFTGLFNDIIDFTAQNRDVISTKFKHQSILLDKTLPRLSFLRTPDPLSVPSNRSYHFIHLTFQEYFAARYFVRNWRARKSLKCLSLDGQPDVCTNPDEFLQKHKYTAQYEIMWRFVAGLLDATGQAKQFIDMLDQEPLDLLGPAHQRLIMQCLSEVSRNSTLRPGLEQRLTRWFLFECEFYRSTNMAREVEAPDTALIAALSHSSDNDKQDWLRTIGIRATITPNLAKQVAGFLDADSEYLRDDAAKVLQKHARAVAGMRKNADVGIQRAADFALRTLEEEEADADEPVLLATGIADQASSPKTVLDLVAMLKDTDASVRWSAGRALAKQASLSETMLNAVAAMLKDTNAEVRWGALLALANQASLPETILEAVAAMLKDANVTVRRGAVEALAKQASLPKTIFEAVAAMLKDADGIVRWMAVRALGRQASLPETMLNAVAALLKDTNKEVRWCALLALADQASLPETILDAVAAMLKNADERVQGFVELLLRQHRRFYCELFNGPYAVSLYTISLQQSFSQQLIWYFDDGHLCVNTPDYTWRIPDYNFQGGFKAMINEARPKELPTIGGGSSEPGCSSELLRR